MRGAGLLGRGRRGASDLPRVHAHGENTLRRRHPRRSPFTLWGVVVVFSRSSPLHEGVISWSQRAVHPKRKVPYNKGNVVDSFYKRENVSETWTHPSPESDES